MQITRNFTLRCGLREFFVRVPPNVVRTTEVGKLINPFVADNLFVDLGVGKEIFDWFNPFYALENLLRIELKIGVAKLLQNKSLR